MSTTTISTDSKKRPKKHSDSDFIAGILYACQILVTLHDEPVFACDIMRQSGFKKEDFLKEQAKTGYQTRKMNPVIRDAFR